MISILIRNYITSFPYIYHYSFPNISLGFDRLVFSRGTCIDLDSTLACLNHVSNIPI
ncbi:unnamed protein product [Arabidopsis halleri]